ALQAGELAAQEGVGVGALLVAVEQGQVAGQEGGEVAVAAGDGVGGDGGLLQEILGSGVLKDGGHAYPPSSDAEGNASQTAGRRVESSRTVEIASSLLACWT